MTKLLKGDEMKMLTEEEFRRDPALMDEFSQNYEVYKAYHENVHLTKVMSRPSRQEKGRRNGHKR